MAAPIMSGFLALMLAEFQDDFTKSELIKVCRASTIRMHNDSDWKNKTTGGVLDMRTALFTLHVIKKIRILKKGYSFDQLLKNVQTVLFSTIEKYSKKYLSGKSLKNSCMDFLQASQQHHYTIPSQCHTLGKAIDFAACKVLSLFSSQTQSGSVSSDNTSK